MSELLDAFARVRRERGDSPLVFGFAEPSWSAVDLDTWADLLIARLAAARLTPGSPIVTALGNRAEFIAALLAAVRSGHPLLPADPGTTVAGVLDLARSFGATAILSAPGLDAGHAETLPGGTRLSLIPGMPLHVFDDVAVLKLTSGSTGLPKAVLASAGNLVRDVEQIVSGMDIRPDDVQLGTIPLSHAYGLGNLATPVLWQGTRVALREGFVPQRLHDDVVAFGIRSWPGVPFMFEHLLAHPVPALPRSLQLIVSAGAPLAPRVLERFHRRFARKIHSFYGTSETGGITFDATDLVDDRRGVGTPLPHAVVTLRSVDGLDATAGCRVHVAGPSVARGYSRTTGDADFCDGGFLTGDLGRIEPDGRLLLTGRLSAFVNVAGRKVHPDEVARHLHEMPGVRDVRVVGAPSSARGEQLVAILVVAGAPPSLLQVRRFCATLLPPHKIPRAVIVIDAIPVDARGKTDRRALEALVRAQLGGGERV